MPDFSGRDKMHLVHKMMKSLRALSPIVIIASLFLPMTPLQAHVTLRPAQPLRPGGFATVNLNVPTERPVPTVSVTLEVPDAFLKVGGRLSRVEYPSGWEVQFEKQDKPGDVFEKETTERKERTAASGAEKQKTPEDQTEEAAMNELRKQWIKRVTFSGGSIPADGFKNFLLSFQMPDQAGSFRFPAVQKYEDGKEVGWTELVEGAEHPAPTLAVEEGGPSPIAQNAPLAIGGLVLLAFGWLLGRRPKTA
jgi:hypothetical protein